MTNDLDLRAIHQHHDPDPRFVAALEDRIQGVLAAAGAADDTADEPSPGAIELEATPVSHPPHPLRHRRTAQVAVAIVAVAASLAALVLLTNRDAEPAPTNPVGPPRVIVPGPNGWIAFGEIDDVATDTMVSDAGRDSDIYLARVDATPRRVAGSDDDLSDQVCPAFSPYGARLAYGQATIERVDEDSFDSIYEADAGITIAEVSPDGTTTVVKTIPVAGATAPPCAIWSPSGRWLAFAAGTEVWLVDTETDAVRTLPGYGVSDLDWRPGTDELAIARARVPGEGTTTRPGRSIDTYSLTTDEFRSLDVEDAVEISWSPDGTTLAFTRVASGTTDQASLWLVDADGSNEQKLADYAGFHGIGPVWSPAGDRIAYQRYCTKTAEWKYHQEHPGAFPEYDARDDPHLLPEDDARINDSLGNCGEQHEVVLRTVGEGSETPDGTEAVVQPPMTYQGDQPGWWYPYSVTWSPDATMLLYHAFGNAHGDGILAVPIDTTKAPIVLVENVEPSVYVGSPSPWLPTQTWATDPDD